MKRVRGFLVPFTVVVEVGIPLDIYPEDNDEAMTAAEGIAERQLKGTLSSWEFHVYPSSGTQEVPR